MQLKNTALIREFEIFAEGLDHAEGLVFDSDHNVWAGGEPGQIYCIDQKGLVKEDCPAWRILSGPDVSRNQDLFVCNSTLSALQQLDRSGRLISQSVQVGGRKLLTPNFSVFDSEGNLYFSDLGEWRKANGCVYRLRANGKAEYLAGPFAFPNGLALSADERSLLCSTKSERRRLAVTYFSERKCRRAGCICRRVRARARRLSAGCTRQPSRNVLCNTQPIPRYTPTGNRPVGIRSPEAQCWHARRMRRLVPIPMFRFSFNISVHRFPPWALRGHAGRDHAGDVGIQAGRAHEE
jgi:SMP-30/Gluconolactonase/LRE-like region